MTSSEVRALIDAKIKGQGTNVDAGSVLPIILNGILDLINEGGGGTSDAVQYVPQTLTSPQQMQARKNQGLYYEGTSVEENDITLSMFSNSPKSYSWKGVLFYFQWDKPNQTPYPAPRTIADVLSFGWEASGQTTEMDVVVGENAALVAEGVYVLYGPDADPEIGPSSGVENYQYCIVAFEGNEESLDAGFYYPLYNEYYVSKYIDSVKYLAAETVLVPIPEKYLSEAKSVKYVPQELTKEQQMQARKNQGLYYEETATERLEYDPDGQQVSAAGYSGEYFIKASDIPIELADLGPQITSYAWNSDTSEVETVIVDITSEMIDEQDDYYRILADPEDTSALPLMIVVLVDSATIWSTTLTKGVWFGLKNDGWHPDWVEHSATTVHQIPAKYIPDIPIPSGGIETVELLSIPTNYANSVAESTFFSADDLAKVKSSDVCIAAYSASPARKFLVVNDAGTLTFYGTYGVEFMLVPYYAAGYFTVYPVNGGSIILSGLPTASMTSAELEALGFGSTGINFYAWVTARAKNVFINDMFSSQVLGIVALTTTYLEFWDATNKYVVTRTGGTTLACTVTPRT